MVEVSRTVERLAPELLEHLRRSDGPVRLESLELCRAWSMPTRRRAIRYLRDLGAPIGSDASFGQGRRRPGYWLEDKGWRMPTQVMIVENPERVVYSGNLKAAKTSALLRELERRGFVVTGSIKVGE